MSNWLRRHPALVLFVSMALLFRLFPGIDLMVSGWFYAPGQGFFAATEPLVRFSYLVFAKLHFVVAALLFWMLFASWYWRGPAEKGLRKRIWFLVAVLALGPGLTVNEVLKAHSGRARPATVAEFGGDRVFTPAFVISDQCGRNCSFVSGHAAMGFFLIALAWVFRDRRWLWAGIVLGGLVGLGRIVQGAHFLSDVVFSFWTVYATCGSLAWLMFGSFRCCPSERASGG